MPCVVRDSGKMWNKDNALEDVKCVIPDRCYATMYQEIIAFVKQNGQVRMQCVVVEGEEASCARIVITDWHLLD